MTTSPAAPDERLLRSSGVMAVGTTLSRVLGFVRAVVIGSALGTALTADTYNVGNSLGTILYILLAGGALNAVFVPQLVRAMKQPDGGGRYTDGLLTVAGAGLAVVTVAATLAAPLLVRVYTTSWTSGDRAVATAFAYWCLPQIFFFGLFALLGQVLNAHNRFGPMMWAPIANNVVVIATGLLFIAVATVDFYRPGSLSSGEIALLGAGTTLGIVVQTLVLVPVLRRTGYRFRPRLDLRGLGLRKAAVLAGWTFGFVAVNQLGYVVVVNIATAASKAAQDVGVGVGFTAYQNAHLIFMLPHSIATVSIVTALLPRMSRAAADGRRADLRADVSSGLRMTGVATVPATVAFLALGRDLTTVMYARAGLADARYVGWVLTGFAVGLVLFSAQHLVLRGFYAQEDTRTPFFVQIGIVTVNVGCALLAAALLPARWTTVGMAAGYAVSYAAGLLLSSALLRRRVGSLDGSQVRRTYVRLALAAALPGVAAWGAARGVTAALGTSAPAALAATVAGGVVLLVGYVALARLLRIAEVASVLDLVRRRRS